MDDMNIREQIAEEYPDVDLLFMDGEEYDEAIIGVSDMCAGTSNNYRVVYDFSKVLEINMDQGMTDIEAIEWYDYNQGCAYVGENTPIFVRMRSDIIGE
jgi:hypothetical protein